MTSEEPVTLFITGLPANTTEREVYLLFVTMPGFKRGAVRYSPDGKPPMAFTTFNNLENAEIARMATDGLCFDFLNPDKKMKVAMSTTPSYSDRADRVVTSNRASLMKGLEEELREVKRKLETHETAFGTKYQPYHTSGKGFDKKGSVKGAKGSKGHKETTPSSTVYVTDTSRQEISEQLMQTLTHNMDSVKYVHVKGSCAWVAFESVDFAAQAFSLEGWQDGHQGPLHVQYSKSK